MRFSTRLLAGIGLISLFVSASAVSGVPSIGSKSANALSTTSNISYDSMKVMAGMKHLCWRDMGNGAVCSGDNTLGQLGTGNNTSTLYGKDFKRSALAGAVNLMEFANGNNHTCAVGSPTMSPASAVYCWGDNTYGQLGDGTNIAKNQLTLVADNGSFTNTNISKVWAGGDTTCVSKSNGSAFVVYCWGRNDQGQLGNGNTTNANIPVPLGSPFNTTGILSGTDVAIGDSHACATSNAGSYDLYCWGDNQYGQLGDGTTTDRTSPVVVSGMSNVQQPKNIGAGFGTTCSRASSTVKCWGLNDKGQVGDGTTTNRSTPTTVSNSGGFTNATNGVSMAFALGGKTSCMHHSVTLYCWGDNSTNQVSSAATASFNTPQAIAAAGSFTNNGARGNIDFSVSPSLTNGFVCYGRYCWGDNTWGQLSQNNTTAATTAVRTKTVTVSADTVSAPSISSASFSSTANKIVINVTGLLAGASIRVMIKPPDYVQGSTILSPALVSNPTITGGAATIDATYYMMSIGMSMPTTYNIDKTKTYVVSVMQIGAAGVNNSYADGFTSNYSSSVTVAPSSGSSNSSSSSSSNSSTATTGSYANAIPGVTITDAKVYTKAPAKVSADSAINAMTPAEAKNYDIVSKTPSVCLPNDDDLVFLDDGKCIATIVNVKTRAVLRTLKTTVVATDISTLQVGNEIAVLSPLYFEAGSADMKASSSKRLTSLLPQIKKAGSILIAGHSGTLMGNTPENQALSKKRATSVVVALKKLGSTAPIAIAAVGALDPASTGTSKAAQDKNRRAVVVLIP